jgi:hypothetical protein
LAQGVHGLERAARIQNHGKRLEPAIECGGLCG